MEHEKLIYTIYKEDYLLVELIIHSRIDINKLDDAISKLNIIEQGIKEIKQSKLFINCYIVVKLLIPVINVKKFQEFDLIKYE